MTTVTVRLVIPPGVPTVSAKCTVRIRDITYSDAPESEPVDQNERVICVDPMGPPPEFSLDVPDDIMVKVGAGEVALNVEAHIDVDGNGVFSPGDMVSMQAQPIGPGTTGPLDVPLVLV